MTSKTNLEAPGWTSLSVICRLLWEGALLAAPTRPRFPSQPLCYSSHSAGENNSNASIHAAKTIVTRVDAPQFSLSARKFCQ